MLLNRTGDARVPDARQPEHEQSGAQFSAWSRMRENMLHIHENSDMEYVYIWLSWVHAFHVQSSGSSDKSAPCDMGARCQENKNKASFRRPKKFSITQARRIVNSCFERNHNLPALFTEDAHGGIWKTSSFTGVCCSILPLLSAQLSRFSKQFISVSAASQPSSVNELTLRT